MGSNRQLGSPSAGWESPVMDYWLPPRKVSPSKGCYLQHFPSARGDQGQYSLLL